MGADQPVTKGDREARIITSIRYLNVKRAQRAEAEKALPPPRLKPRGIHGLSFARPGIRHRCGLVSPRWQECKNTSFSLVLPPRGGALHSARHVGRDPPPRCRCGRRTASSRADLLPLVYDELRKLVAPRSAWPPKHPATRSTPPPRPRRPTCGLVGDQQFDGRRHFFAAAAEAMRRILIEVARRKAAVRHGGGRRRVPLEDAQPHPGVSRRVARPRRGSELSRGHGTSEGETRRVTLFRRANGERSGGSPGLSRRRRLPAGGKFARLWLYAELQGEKKLPSPG